MELSALAKSYSEFYAPSYAVRVARTDLMRDLLVAVSQVDVDMVLGAASRFTFTVSNCYSHKLAVRLPAGRRGWTRARWSDSSA